MGIGVQIRLNLHCCIWLLYLREVRSVSSNTNHQGARKVLEGWMATARAHVRITRECDNIQANCLHTGTELDRARV